MRVLLSSLVVVLLASACAGSATLPPASTSPPATVAPPTQAAVAPTSAPSSPAGPTVAPTLPAEKPVSAAPVKTWTEVKGFRKSDQKYLASTGRPQFVEFFAYW